MHLFYDQVNRALNLLYLVVICQSRDSNKNYTDRFLSFIMLFEIYDVCFLSKEIIELLGTKFYVVNKRVYLFSDHPMFLEK